VKIRRATAQDSGAIKAIDPLAGSRKDLLKHAIRERGVFVLVDRDRLLAFAILRRIFFERYFLELLLVHPDHRRQGLGSRLIGRMEEIAKVKGELWTSTNESNRPMRRLLVSRGYRRAGKIIGLDHGDPEIFFVRPLASGT
jgi:ribosomal protein S18 acetylase RimI-like enzyme